MVLLTLKDLKRLNGPAPLMIGGSGVEQLSVLNRTDILLGYSTIPGDDIDQLKLFIERCGYSVYLFRMDPSSKEWNTDYIISRFKKISEKVKCFLWASDDIRHDLSFISWFFGYFDSLKEKAAFFPLLKRDINSKCFSINNLLSGYPYIMWGMNFFRKRELFICRDSKTYTDLNYWIHTENMYIKWEN